MNLSVNGINLPDEETWYQTANDIEKHSSDLDKYLITSADKGRKFKTQYIWK